METNALFLPTEDKTVNFVGLSTVGHAVLVALVLIASQLEIFQPVKHDVVTVEIISAPAPFKAQRVEMAAPAAPKVAAIPAQEIPTQVEAPPIAKGPDVAIDKADILAPAKAKPTQPAPAKKSVARHERAAQKAAQHSVARKLAPVAKPIEAIAQDSDIAVPELETPELETPKSENLVTGDIAESDYADGLKKVDAEQNAVAAKVNSEIDNDNKTLDENYDKSLNAVVDANQKEAKELTENSKRLAAQRQKEFEAGLARKHASEQAAAAKAAKDAEGTASRDKGPATAKSATTPSGGDSSGSPTNVRKLSDLRQMPGNKKPEYDAEERLNNKTGQASFLAYISKAGTPTDFKLMKSTGHRSLDLKTLKAIKSWKFYPGQEGWVEIPINWDLKGGAKEWAGLLRRGAGPSPTN